MKILALSDVHGSYRRMHEIISSNPFVDMIIIAGDLTTNGSAPEAEEVITGIRRHGKPLLVVAGNMDPPPLDDIFLRLGVSINGRGVAVGNIGFCGVSASPISRLRTPNEITEEEIAARAECGFAEISHTSTKVFVPHAPPFNTRLDVIHSGRHVGSSAVRTSIERHNPHVVICGHIHEARGTDTIGTSQIINCGPVGGGYYGLISIDDAIVVECREQS